MRNVALEDQIAALCDRGIGPLSLWRTLGFADLVVEARIVDAAAASIIAVSRLAPPDLIAELTAVREEEKAPVWSELAVRFFELDAMTLGLCYEVAGTCAALAALNMDALGTVLLLKALSEPYLQLDPSTRIAEEHAGGEATHAFMVDDLHTRSPR
jgi:hypothetical protein